MITKVTTPPNYRVLALATLKEHLKLDASDTSEDTLLESYLAAAEQQAQGYVSGYFMPHTVEVYLEGWALNFILYGITPLQVVDKLEYFADGNWQELGTEHYSVFTPGPAPRVRITGDQPSHDDRPYPIRITAQVGYSLSTDSETAQRQALDGRIQSAVLLQAARLYETREDANMKTGMITAAERLLSGLRSSFA